MLAGDTSQGDYDPTPFKGQIITFGLTKAYHMSLKTLFDICRSLHAWLSLDDSNVAIVHCTNGVGRTGVTLSCYLRYAEIFDDTSQAFEYFVSRRTPEDSSWVGVAQRRYIQYFNNVLLLNGSLPTSYPLHMQKIVMNGIPSFDGRGGCDPGIEIYQSGKLVFSSVAQASHRSGGSTSSAGAGGGNNNNSVAKRGEVKIDVTQVVFVMPTEPLLLLEKDVQVRIFHTLDAAETPNQVVTMVNFSFHTGFMPAGLIRVRSQDLDLSRRDVEEGRFPRGFSLDLMLSETVSQTDMDQGIDRGFKAVHYTKFLDRSLPRCLARLISYHIVKVDEGMMRTLEELGASRLMGECVFIWDDC
jgi:hypothetical protein